MCIITATAVATALGLSTAAATAAAGTSAVSAAGIIAGAANAAIALGAIGSAVTGIATSSIQAKNQQAMYNYQAQVDRNNARIANQNAANERQSGLEESRLQRMKTLSNIGNQQTAMAANGIDITSGTALDTIEDTATAGELDALMTMYNSERTAINYEQQAANFNNQANLDSIAGKNARKAGTINALSYGFDGISNAAGSFGGLGNIGKVSSKWGNFKNKFSGGLKTSDPWGAGYQFV